MHFLAKLKALIISALGVDLSGEHAPGTSKDVLRNTHDKKLNKNFWCMALYPFRPYHLCVDPYLFSFHCLYHCIVPPHIS